MNVKSVLRNGLSVCIRASLSSRFLYPYDVQHRRQRSSAMVTGGIGKMTSSRRLSTSIQPRHIESDHIVWSSKSNLYLVRSTGDRDSTTRLDSLTQITSASSMTVMEIISPLSSRSPPSTWLDRSTPFLSRRISSKASFGSVALQKASLTFPLE